MLGYVIRVVIVGLSMLVLLEARISTTYPAITVLASEREKKTILTTLSMPVSHSRLLTGKCIATLVIAFFPIFWNALALVCLMVFLAGYYDFNQTSVIEFLALATASAPLIVPAILLDNWLATIFYFLLCCVSRS